MELVFARYPEWKWKVLRIASIQREKRRLLIQSRDEQQRSLTTAASLVLSQADIMNERAELVKEKMNQTRWTRTHSLSSSLDHLPIVYKFKKIFIIPLYRVLSCVTRGVPAQSPFHIFWLRFMVFCTVYIAIVTPYQLAIDPMDRLTVITAVVNILTLLSEAAFVVDVWFSWHVKESKTAMELYEQNLATVYKKERMMYDVIAATPFYGFLAAFNCSSRLKLLRCFKMLNMMGYLDELSRSRVANELTKFAQVSLVYLLVVYWAACAYLVVAMEIGFGSEWESWLPSKALEISDPENPSSAQLTLRLLRGLFFATTAFVKKARNIAPDTASAYAFQIAMSFIGLLTMSFVIGELASLFISRSSLEVGFRKNHIAVKMYLERVQVSGKLKARTSAFMATLWASHAGLNYDELLADMPREIRSACVLHAAKIPLNWFVMKLIGPICGDADANVEAFTLSLAEHLRFEAYSRNEDVITEGRIVQAMYFVTKGFLNMQSSSLLDRPVGLRDGSYFGERGLLGSTISAYTVTTARACDLFSLRSEAFAQVLRKHEFSTLALDVCNRAYKELKVQRVADCSRIDMEGLWGAALLDAMQDLRNHSRTPSGEESVEKTTNQAPKQLASCPVFEALDTTQSSFEAFMPLLYIILPTDPLDWKTSFGQV